MSLERLIKYALVTLLPVSSPCSLTTPYFPGLTSSFLPLLQSSYPNPLLSVGSSLWGEKKKNRGSSLPSIYGCSYLVLVSPQWFIWPMLQIHIWNYLLQTPLHASAPWPQSVLPFEGNPTPRNKGKGLLSALLMSCWRSGSHSASPRPSPAASPGSTCNLVSQKL